MIVSFLVRDFSASINCSPISTRRAFRFLTIIRPLCALKRFDKLLDERGVGSAGSETTRSILRPVFLRVASFTYIASLAQAFSFLVNTKGSEAWSRSRKFGHIPKWRSLRIFIPHGSTLFAILSLASRIIPNVPELRIFLTYFKYTSWIVPTFFSNFIYSILNRTSTYYFFL